MKLRNKKTGELANILGEQNEDGTLYFFDTDRLQTTGELQIAYKEANE